MSTWLASRAVRGDAVSVRTAAAAVYRQGQFPGKLWVWEASSAKPRHCGAWVRGGCSEERSMQYEVEQKFPVADLAAVAADLAAMGAEIAAAEEEMDLYFAHPARDFAVTDEALRLRRKGPRGYITYKGPKIDAVTKTRREIELPLVEAAGGPAEWRGLLEALGFRPVAEVRKLRRKALVSWQGRRVEVSLDAVEGLGTFVELELMAGAEEVAAARASIAALAGQLRLTGSERRSYLELLLQRREKT